MTDQNNREKEPRTLLEIKEVSEKRVAVITNEFKNGFEFIKNYPRSVTFFGSARTKEGDESYEKARRIAGRIVTELRYSVLTGGGPGIMEAGNRGAFEAGGNSLGLNIELPNEQVSNPYLTHSIDFHYFFSRKVCLSYSAEAYLFFPGGFGTLDEFLEILTLVQTNKIPKTPIILVGEEYWNPLADYFQSMLLQKNLISNDDINLYTITNNEDLILDIVKNAPVRIGLGFNDSKNHSTNDPQKESTKNNIVEGPLSTLSQKHCVPCEGKIPALSKEKTNEFLKEIDNNWEINEDKEIFKTYEFFDFKEAMNFMNAIGILSEKEGHHPDLKIHDYKKVTVRISTHAINGLTENDFILASKIDAILRDRQF